MLRILALTLALAASTGCYTMNAQMPGTLRTDVPADQTEKVGTLSYETTHWYFLLGLIGAPPEDVFAQEIKKQVQARGADGVANLNYEGKFACFDIILTGCTCYIISPRTYQVTGDIVRIKAAPLPGKPAKAADASDATKPQETQVAQGY
jgi:hypothetical protein